MLLSFLFFDLGFVVVDIAVDMLLRIFQIWIACIRILKQSSYLLAGSF
jgi:hypothetical protein